MSPHAPALQGGLPELASTPELKNCRTHGRGLSDCLVELVKDRPCRQQVLCGAKCLLHSPQLLVAQHGLERVQVGVGAQHEDAVELLVLLDPVGINREMIVANGLEITAVPGVADQRFILASCRSKAAKIKAR